MSIEKFTLSGDAGPTKRQKTAVRMKAWRRRNPEKAKARYKADGILYRQRHVNDLRDRKQRYYKRHAERISVKSRCSKYGVSAEALVEMMAQCEGCCPQCKTPFGDAKNLRPCVDHCHETGAIRGILCGRCNLLLGLAKDDPGILRGLASYLERPLIKQGFNRECG